MIAPFRNGPPETVAKMNEIIKAVNSFTELTGDGIIQTRHTPAGTAIGLSIPKLRRRLVHGRAVPGVVRLAYVKTTPGAVSAVDCFLDTDATGQEVSVNCSIVNGGSLNAAVPRLADGEIIFVVNISGTWWCVTTFHASQSCPC